MCQFSNGLSVCDSWSEGKREEVISIVLIITGGDVEGASMEENKETSSGAEVKHGGSGSQEIRV